MKISAISNYAYQSKSNLGFKGVLVDKGAATQEWDYHGEVSSSSGPDGHYVGANDYQYYIYHPFKDETEDVVQKTIKEGNYTMDYTSMGYGGGYNQCTELGKTLPFTEKEWNALQKDTQQKILSIL